MKELLTTKQEEELRGTLTRRGIALRTGVYSANKQGWKYLTPLLIREFIKKSIKFSVQ